MSNPERTAERPSHLCEAYGCPMLGTRSAGIAGGGFMCHVHAGRDPSELQAITVEVNRLAWLSHAIRDIRTRARNPSWRETYARIDHDIVLAQREDLRCKGGDANLWMIRLEGELARLIKESLGPTQEQQAMAM